MLKTFFLTVLLFGNSDIHPIHVSVTDVEYDAERKALEIVSHIFLDDLEKHIRLIKNEPYLDVLNPKGDKTSNDLIKNYYKERFKLIVNGKEEDYNFLGYEHEGAAVYIYVELEKVKKLKSLTVRNEILLQLFDDQVNLVHVKVDGKIRSMKLEDGDEMDTLEY